jgi:hypothetical protein
VGRLLDVSQIWYGWEDFNGDVAMKFIAEYQVSYSYFVVVEAESLSEAGLKVKQGECIASDCGEHVADWNTMKISEYHP